MAAVVLQFEALVLAHELVFLARYGSRYGEALAHAGHGETWTAAVLSSLALAALLAAIGAVQLARLGLLVGRRGSPVGPSAGGLEPASLLRAWLHIGPRTAVLSVVILSIQENLERAAMGLAAPGPGILLSAEYAGGLWITIAVGLLVGLVAALFAWRRSVLLAKLRSVRARVPRGSHNAVLRPRPRVPAPAASVLGRRSALRAPPLVSVT
jgi:hypothetical protein